MVGSVCFCVILMHWPYALLLLKISIRQKTNGGVQFNINSWMGATSMIVFVLFKQLNIFATKLNVYSFLLQSHNQNLNVKFAIINVWFLAFSTIYSWWKIQHWLWSYETIKTYESIHLFNINYMKAQLPENFQSIWHDSLLIKYFQMYEKIIKSFDIYPVMVQLNVKIKNTVLCMCNVHAP